MKPRTRKSAAAKAPKAIASTQSLSAFVKGICDVMRRSNCASALQYVPELTWILFLRILDAQEARDAEQAEALGAEFSPALRSPYRWQDWAAPQGRKRKELFAAGDGRLFDFINKELLPHLHALDVDPRTNLPNPAASPKQRIIGRIMTAVERVRVDDETNLRDILDRVHEISIDHIDDTHFFTLSQVYEDLLLKMGEKNSDGGQFFTPREVIRAMVHTVNPSLGQTVYDPCCGTGGFLAVAYEHIARKLGNAPVATDIEKLKHDTFFGREKENLVFPIALANLVLHGIDQPNLWHGNSLTRRAKARDEMQPLQDKTAGIKAAVVDLKEDLKRLKKERADERKIEALEADIREREKVAHDLETEAAAIDAAVFDLKAVNPNVVATVDERTPAQIIASIDAQGQIVAQALGRLKG